MTHGRRIRLAVLCLLVISGGMLLLPRCLVPARERLPGHDPQERKLLRIWVTDAPGGGMKWLQGQLKRFSDAHPGVMTYLRTVPPEELGTPGAVLPDLLLHMPGNLQQPEAALSPLSGSLTVRESLLRCGRWQGEQYGLPLCWGAWVLAFTPDKDDALPAPEPTSLLGRPSATAAPMKRAAYPLPQAMAAALPLMSPEGAALLSLQCILSPDERPPVDRIGAAGTADVFSAFRSGRCFSAMLTTGQLAALEDSGSVCTAMPPAEIVTDQVWLAGVTRTAIPEAAELLAFLTGPDAQRALSSQSLHTAREDLTLYAAGVSHQVEQAARLALAAPCAYLPQEQIRQAAWQALQGRLSLSDALLPLL